MSDKKLYTITKTDTSIPCEVTLEVTLTKEAINGSKAKALATLNEQVKIDGFRPGHVPEKVLIEKVGEYTVTEEACRSYIDEVFGEIVVESKLIPVNQPQIIITKLAVDTDAELKITFATPPVIELGDYKKVAKKHNTEKGKETDSSASDAEVDAMILDLRKQVAHMNHHATGNHAADDHSHGDLEPVELNDEFAQKVGPFKTVDELKAAVTKNIGESKAQKVLEKFRIALIDEVIEDAKISYPSFFLTAEQNIMLEEIKNDVTRMGASFADYLKHVGKTEKELVDERKDLADKRVKTQLVLSKISVLEDIKPNADIVTEQVKEIKKMHPEALEENVKAFVERFELNQLVWKFLEGIK